MARRHAMLFSFLAGAAVAALTAAVARADPRAVVELFTSQGCSSCPPADQLLGELAHDPSIVALSLPVDYWDYLGWKDTLASHDYTLKQRNYARARGDMEVYTPQVVVNGRVHVLGSDKAAISRAIAQSPHEAMAVPVKMTTDSTGVTVTLAGNESAHLSGEVWICGISKTVPVAIGRGENRGSTITYHNVARRWVRLGEWSGKSETWTVPIGDIKTDGVNAAAVIVQSGNADKPGTMLGAAFTTLN